uniref:VWFA domain-containing protein n=1 Tax=Schistosoma mansoni TaxID=6183 RepID=A0A3Q0KNV5_SCHMA
MLWFKILVWSIFPHLLQSFIIQNQECLQSIKADIVFLLDGTKVIDEFSFEFYVKDYLSDFAKKLSIKSDGVLISVILFTDQIHFAVKPEHSVNLPSLLMAIHNMKQPDKNLMKADITHAILNILNFGFISTNNADTQNITRMLILLTNGNIPEEIQHKDKQIITKSDEIIQELHSRVNYAFSIGIPGANQPGVRKLAKPSQYAFTLNEFNGYKELDLKFFDPTEVICPMKIPRYCSEIRRSLSLRKPIEKVNGQTVAVNPWYQYAYQKRRSGTTQPRNRYSYNDYEYYYDYGDYNEGEQPPVRPVSVPNYKSRTNDESLNVKLTELLYLLRDNESRKKIGLTNMNLINTVTTTAPTITSTLPLNYYRSLQHKSQDKKFNRRRYQSSLILPSYSKSDDIHQMMQKNPITNYSIMMNQSNLNNRTENNCEMKLNKMANILLKLIEQTLQRNYSTSGVHENSSNNNYNSIELLKPASISYSLNSSQYAYPEVTTSRKRENLTSINERYWENKSPLINDNNNSQTSKQYKDGIYHSTYKTPFQATDWEDSAMHNGAILMFSMKSHSGLSINKMYFSSRNITSISNKNTASNEMTADHTTGDTDISSKRSNGWYKHDLFDQWYSGSYKYVLFELWSNNNPVVQLRFNAQYSDKYTWFNKLFLKTSYPWNEYELLEKAKFILTSNEAFSVVFDPNYIVLLSSVDYNTVEKLKSERIDCEFLRGYILIVDSSKSAISQCEWNNATNSKYNNFPNISNYHDYPKFFYTLPINSRKEDSLNYHLPPKFSNYLFTLYEADELRIYVIPYSLMPSKIDGILLPQTNKLLFILDTGINISFSKLWYQEIASPPSAFPLKHNILCHCWYRNQLLNNWYKPKTHYHTQNTNHFLTSNLFFGFQNIKIELFDRIGHLKCCLIFDTYGAQVNSWFSLKRLKYSWPWSMKTLTKYNFVQFGDQILTSGKKHYLSLRNWSNFNFWIGKQTLLIEPSSNMKRTTYTIKCLSIFLVYSRNNESDHIKLPECMKGQTNLFKDTTKLTILAFNEDLTELNNMKKAQQITIWSN